MVHDWLEPLGPVQVQRAVRSEERAVDVLAHATRTNPRWRQILGLWGRMATGWTGIEVYRNPVTAAEVQSAQAKGIDLWDELKRRARRKGRRAGEVRRPQMWVITPTMSAELREHLALRPMEAWVRGFLHVSEGWSVAVVVAHELPATPETLFLRLLGRAGVQREAFAELETLSREHPLRRMTVTHVLRYRKEAEETSRPTQEQREVVMQTQAWVEKWERDLIARGEAEGEARGEARGKAAAVLAVLHSREVEVTSGTEERISECADVAELDRWLAHAAKVERVEDLFASSKTKAAARKPKKRR